MGDPQLPITVYFDGSVTENPGGRVAYGFHFEQGYEESGVAFDGGESATNNVAEYIALIRALNCISHEVPSADVDHYLIRGDSQLVVRQMTGEWNVNSDNLKPLHALASMLVDDLRNAGCVVEFEWIRREENDRADNLSKEEDDG